VSVWRLLFNGAYRRARQAEGSGEYRRAAALYAEADAPDEAANALLFLAARTGSLEERLTAWHDALRWLPEGHPRRAEVEGRIGRALLEQAQRHGVHGADDRRRVREAAQRLEGVRRCAEAATAWELLGEAEEAARCLEEAGEVERLEKLWERMGAADARERQLQKLLSDYEMAMKVGARLEARDALRAASEVSPDDGSVADLLRRLEQRLPRAHRVEMEIEGRRTLLVGTLPAVLGRADADVPLRATAVSRRHAQLERRDGQFAVRDLGSRNGTLVQGVPISGVFPLHGPTELGLGEHLELHVQPAADGSAVRAEIVRGVDRGLRIWIGDGPLRPDGVAAGIRFPDGHATLQGDPGASVRLNGHPCAAPIVVVRQDVVEVDDTRVEVRS
jgi:tetratricopeptide (TPR) repeat protein